MLHKKFIYLLVLGLLLLAQTAAAQGLPPADGAPALDGNDPLTLAGKPGMFFSFNSYIGESEVPYLEDAAHLNDPGGIWVDGDGNVFVTENIGGRLMKYAPDGTFQASLGMIGSRVLMDDRLQFPQDVVTAADGSIYVIDYCRVAKYDAAMQYQYQYPADDPWNCSSDDDHFRSPSGIALDGTTLFVSDRENQRIQVLDVSGDTQAGLVGFIGTSYEAGSDDSHFNNPVHIAVDASHNLYVADEGNDRIQQCTESGGVWGCFTYFEAPGLRPRGVAVDGSGNVLFTSLPDGGSYTTYKCTAADTCTDLAVGENGYDLAVAPGGEVYQAQGYAHRVLKYSADFSAMDTFAGTLDEPYLTDASHFFTPRIAVDKSGSRIVLEENGQRLVKLNKSNAVQWVLGTPGITRDHNNVASANQFHYPKAVTSDVKGSIYVGDANRVAIFNKYGVFQSFIGDGTESGNYGFRDIMGIAVDTAGNIYVSDTWNHRVQVYNKSRVYVATLGVTDEPGSDPAHFNEPRGLVVDAAGNLYVADTMNFRVQKFNKKRVLVKTFGTGTDWDALDDIVPVDVALDGKGNLYVAEDWKDRITVLTKSGAYLATIGGTWGSMPAQMRSAQTVEVDSKGRVYVGEVANARVQVFNLDARNWAQINLNGFGNPATQVYSVGSFKGSLYAGTNNGTVLRRVGSAWKNSLNFGKDFGAVDHLLVFKNKLYASGAACATENCDQPGDGGVIWRTSNGSAWEPVADAGFGMVYNVEVERLGLSEGQLCAGTWSYNSAQGGEVWCSPSGAAGTWVNISLPGLNVPDNSAVMSLQEFKGYTYIGTLNGNTGAQVLRKQKGVAGWAPVLSNDGSLLAASGMAVFKNNLYVAFRGYPGEGAKIKRCALCDGSDWVDVTTDGFGNTASYRNPGLAVVGKALYAVIGNNIMGFELLRTTNGATWARVGQGGVGDSNNQFTYWGNGVVSSGGSLYVGAFNRGTGGKLFKYCPTNPSCN